MRHTSEYLVVEQPQQILTIGVLLQRQGQLLQFGGIDITFAIGDFLRTGYFQTLAVFDGGDELACFQQGFMRAGLFEPVAPALLPVLIKPAPTRMPSPRAADPPLSK